MSQEAGPEQSAPRQCVPQQSPPSPAPGQKGAPKGLLRQMEELMAALSADLTQLDADHQSTQPATDATPPPSPPGSEPRGA
ncbi:hypothetical protein ACFYM2_32885 [Streptomyces sp. NPDC006711]|uniref:hypothetical protein n=1 Tax=unclassified Streptomyces TaxID=2593676 RepID=UPI00368907D9